MNGAQWFQERVNFPLALFFSQLAHSDVSLKFFHGLQKSQIYSRKHKLSKKNFLANNFGMTTRVPYWRPSDIFHIAFFSFLINDLKNDTTNTMAKKISLDLIFHKLSEKFTSTVLRRGTGFLPGAKCAPPPPGARKPQISMVGIKM